MSTESLNYSRIIEAKQEAEAELLSRARRSLLAFTVYTKPNFKINWHHALTCKYLMKWMKGEITHLIISEPPRHGKTELVNRRMVPFIFGQDPNAEIIGASYAADLASRVNRDIQRVIDSERYRNVFPSTRIASKNVTYGERKPLRNNEEFEIIDHEGHYRCAGVGGGITGMGCKYLIIDDPIKDHKQADSEVARQNVWEWMTVTAFSRLEDNSRVLLNMTRWHEDDPAGRLLLQRDSKDLDAMPWVELRLPAIRDDIDNPEDPRQLGDALWPWKYNEDRLRKIEDTAGPRWWSAVYQQRPTPVGGGMFKEDMFEYVDPPTQVDYTFMTADTAYGDKTENDFHVFSLWGSLGEDDLYLLDCWRKRIKAAEVEAAIIPFIQGYQTYGFRGAWIEPKGHGIYLNQKLPKMGIVMPSDSDIKVFFKDRNQKKVERANNVIPHLSRRKVKISNRINDRRALLQEALSFPRAKHDDFVDTLVDALKIKFGSGLSILDLL